MQPYSTPFYFVILGLALIPIVIAQLLGKKLMWYQVLLTIAFLWLTFSGTVTIWALIGFGVFQTIIVKFYEWYRVKQNKNQSFVFYLIILLSILPLVIVKVHPLFNPGPGPGSILGFLGISYISFKTVAMIMEIRDGQIGRAHV